MPTTTRRKPNRRHQNPLLLLASRSLQRHCRVVMGVAEANTASITPTRNISPPRDVGRSLGNKAIARNATIIRDTTTWRSRVKDSNRFSSLSNFSNISSACLILELHEPNAGRCFSPPCVSKHLFAWMLLTVKQYAHQHSSGYSSRPTQYVPQATPAPARHERQATQLTGLGE